MYHIFFIHSSVNGCLSCFHVLAVVNGATVNAGIYVSFQIRVFSKYTPRSGLPFSWSFPTPHIELCFPLCSQSPLYLCAWKGLGTCDNSPLLTFIAGQTPCQEHYVQLVIHSLLTPLGSKGFHPHFTDDKIEADRARI